MTSRFPTTRQPPSNLQTGVALMTSRALRARTFALATGLLLIAVPARADVTRAQCIEANGQAQSLRREEKLAQARELLKLCGDPKCPGTVATDCTKRLDELEAAQPTIVFDVKDGSGRDIDVVKVSVDDRPLTEKLDGTPFQVDPGDHSFTFEVEGQPPVTQHFVLTEGQKARHESVVVGPPEAPPAPAPAVVAPASPSEEPTAAPSNGRRTTRTIGIVLGAAGVAGVATGAVFGLLASSRWSSQQRNCESSTNCLDHAQAVSDHSALTTDGAVSTVAFIAGGALLAGGVALFLIGNREPATKPFAALVVSPSTGAGAALQLKGGF
jgi:hypothetical protein